MNTEQQYHVLKYECRTKISCTKIWIKNKNIMYYNKNPEQQYHVLKYEYRTTISCTKIWIKNNNIMY